MKETRVKDGVIQVRSGQRWMNALEAECVWCGAMFYHPRHFAGQYCSRPCQSKALTKLKRSRMYNKRCPHCGRDFKVPKSYKDKIKTCGATYCSRLQRSISAKAQHQREREAREAAA